MPINPNDATSDAERHAAALADPDAQPLTPGGALREQSALHPRQR
jgi:hypothetical protein